MKNFKIIVKSKNKSSMNNFLLYFKKFTNLNTSNLIKPLKKNEKNKKLSVLKSPHVNKTAQEQFEIRVLKTELSMQITKKSWHFVFLKNLNLNLFSDINLKLLFNTNLKKSNHYNFSKVKVNKYFNFKVCNLNFNVLNKSQVNSKRFQNLSVAKSRFLLLIIDLSFGLHKITFK